MKLRIISLFLFTFVPTIVYASELVYTPVNPNFGGNPLNSSHLFNGANAINDYKAPKEDSLFEQESPLDRLTSSLESRLISQLLADVGNGNTGQLVTDDFILNIVDDSGGLLIQIVDKETGNLRNTSERINTRLISS